MRGRRNDPRDEALRGYPGQRRQRTDQAIRELERKPAPVPPPAVSSSPPEFLRDREARRLWRELVPMLRRLHLISAMDSCAFAMYCSYWGEFIAMTREIEREGYGAARASRRDKAASLAIMLARRFGLTPVDRHKLIRDHAMRNDAEALFARAPVLPGETTENEPASVLGLLHRLDSPGPRKPN
jgi:P27 family predicted phage terminase small subunit